MGKSRHEDRAQAVPEPTADSFRLGVSPLGQEEGLVVVVSDWRVFSEHDAGVVTVRIESPEGHLAEAVLDPEQARDYGADIIQAAALAEAAQENAIDELEAL